MSHQTTTHPELTAEQYTSLVELAENAINYITNLPHNTDDLDVYLVGGAVRDAVLGNTSLDDDYLVLGETVDTMLARGFIDINASSFGVLHDENHNEWALARTETKTGDGYKNITVDTDDVTLREDLKRRDLRMNAMAIHLNTPTTELSAETSNDCIRLDDAGILIDPFNGLGNIQKGIIQHVSDAFSEDPVRVLRAARYASRFEQVPDAPAHLREELPDTVPFTIHADTEQLMKNVSPELNRMSRDRIGVEIVKAMKQATRPDRFWNVLRDAGALAVIAPTLDRASIVPAGPKRYHREGNTYTHTMQVLTRMHELCTEQNITGTDRVRRYLMAVAHDLGKVTLADKNGGLWSDNPPRQFGGHDKAGVNEAETLARTLGLDGHYLEAMQDASRHHMNFHDLPLWDATTLIKFVNKHDPSATAETPYMGTTDELLMLAQADHEGRYQNRDEFYDEDAYTEHDDAPEGAVRPVFDTDVFTETITATRHAIAHIDGYGALKSGLCDTHQNDGHSMDELADQLERCDDCRTPGAWVGDYITNQRADYINQTLETS